MANFYDEDLAKLNKLVAPNCIQYRVVEHWPHDHGPFNALEDEYYCELDHINYRWSLDKEYIKPNNGMCGCECVTVLERRHRHDSCELLKLIRNLIKINTLD